jgi:hypothetical protein
VPNSTANAAIASATKNEIPHFRLIAAGAGFDVGQDGAERAGNRLELQRDIGNRADDGDQRHGCRHGLMLAVAGRNEIRDRSDVLGFGQADDAQHQRIAQPHHQHWADIDRQKPPPVAGCETHRSEECPRRAIDRKRQRIDQHPRASLAAAGPGSVAVARNQEQQADITERDGDDEPALQHGCSDRQGEPADPTASGTGCRAF